MSILVDYQIRARVKNLQHPYPLGLDPFVDYGECPEGVISYGLSSGGYDLRVGYKFLLFSNTSACIVDPKAFRKESFAEVDATSSGFVLIPPNCFALADTLEYIKMPTDLMAEVKGKSRLARCGYVMASTPIEPGWRGRITLEIGNLCPLPLKIYAGEGIGQLIFTVLDAIPEKDYDQKPRKLFQDQGGLTGPDGVRGPLYESFEEAVLGRKESSGVESISKH